MNGAFYIGAIGLDAQQRALEVVANNIANVNTVGFKRSVTRFADLVLARQSGTDAPDASIRSDALSGVVQASVDHVWKQGEMRQTGAQFDLAIDGDGFLELMARGGRTLLWRGGSLKVNTEGLLTAGDGTPLRAMIFVPQGATGIGFASDGEVSARFSDGSSQSIGQIELVMPRSSDGLVKTGAGYYEAADPSNLTTTRPGDEGSGTLAQGMLEGSNVQLANEMTDLLLLQRGFAANAQVVQAGDQIMSIINQLRR